VILILRCEQFNAQDFITKYSLGETADSHNVEEMTELFYKAHKGEIKICDNPIEVLQDYSWDHIVKQLANALSMKVREWQFPSHKVVVWSVGMSRDGVSIDFNHLISCLNPYPVCTKTYSLQANSDVPDRKNTLYHCTSHQKYNLSQVFDTYLLYRKISHT